MSSLPTLSFRPRDEWCAGCATLDTPWAKTAEEKENAVEGVLRAFGPEPTFLRLGIPRPNGGMVGIYGADGKPITAYSVRIQVNDPPCGRIASLKFSRTGELGAHLLERVGSSQPFFYSKIESARSLFDGEPTLVWSDASMRGGTINDMWFSDSLVAADASGAIMVGDPATGTITAASDVPGAAAGDYYSAEVWGSELFVARSIEGRTEWWTRRNGRLEPFLANTERDIRELVTDGTWLVWVEGRDPGPAAPNNPNPVEYAHYALMKAPFARRSADVVPETLVADVPRDFGHLVIANGFVTGIFLISYPAYRAGALVSQISSGTTRRSELPNGYSWGYELYPGRSALWGPVTTGPMITFETIAKIPYDAMSLVEEP